MSGSTRAKPVSFMCDKKQFKDVVRLAELRARLASQAHNPGEVKPDPFFASVLAGMQFLKAKVNPLALGTANPSAKQPAQATLGTKNSE